MSQLSRAVSQRFGVGHASAGGTFAAGVGKRGPDDRVGTVVD